MTDRRAFLFLQGPPGPLFSMLARELVAQGHSVTRVNLSGGDRLDWPRGAIDYRGRFSGWAVFVDRLLRDRGITDLLLFGDCRPYHLTAHRIAALRGVRTHVLEEGYIRPNWMTLEPDGVNARSTLSRSKNWFRKEAAHLPPIYNDAPITAAFKRRARDAYWYYHHVVTGRLRYPHYRSHRPGSIVIEGLGWLWKFAWEKRVLRRTERVLDGLADRLLFVFPLQLSGDYQIRAHSPFRDMQSAATYVIESFARRAPAGVDLVLKRHPLDNSFFNWERFLRRLENQFGIKGRVHVIDGGDLDDLAARARGLVCVNSTSATLALERGTPVCAVGEAIYDIEGLTHQSHPDSFWSAPQPPDPGLYQDFKRVLVDRCLVRGGLASESAVEALVQSMSERLLAPAARTRQAPLSLVSSAAEELRRKRR